MKKLLSIFLVFISLVTLISCGEKTTEVTLYFPDAELELAKEIRSVKGDNIEKAVVEAIIEGPQTEGLSASVTGDVQVISAVTADGMCTIDLSEEFEEYNTGGSAAESITIYSIVNSLCSLDGVERVKFNIEGDTNYEFGGHFYMGEPFEFERNMIRIEDRE